MKYCIVVKVSETRIEKMFTNNTREVEHAADTAKNNFFILSCKIFDTEEDKRIFFSVEGDVIQPLQW